MIDDIPFLAEKTPWTDGAAPACHPERVEGSPPPLRIEPNARFALPRIRAIADKVVAALSPLCERIEIAGSIRRSRALVGDIDLVILPKDRAAIRARLVPACNVLADGPQNLLVDWAFDGARLQLDIFFAHDGVGDFFAREPSNWGTLLICRTGSKEFNIWFAQQAQRAGYHWNPYRGLAKLQGLSSQQQPVAAAATEQELFTTLGLTYIAPEKRER